MGTLCFTKPVSAKASGGLDSKSKIEADGPDAKQSEKHHVQLQLHQARVMSRQQ